MKALLFFYIVLYRMEEYIMRKSILFAMIIIGLFFIITPSFLDKNKVVLDDVEVVDNKEKKAFAIMISTDGTNYTESESDSIPSTGYVLNREKTYCVDLEGNVYNNSISQLSWQLDSVIVNASNTVNCYLFFDAATYDYWNTLYNTTHYANTSTLTNAGYYYYIRTTMAGGNLRGTYEACITITRAGYRPAEVCLRPNDWDNAIYYKEKLESYDLTCTLDNNYLQCHNASLGIRMGSNGTALVYKSST